jgi:hypothetical protein
MIFEDESAGWTPHPTESTKKDRKEKKKGRGKRKGNNKKKELVAVEILWKKKSIFFRLLY